MTEDLLGDVQRNLIGHVGVDTGRIIICDPAYLTSQQLEARVEEALQVQLAIPEYPLHVEIPYLIGTEGAALVVNSGIEDGFYPIYATTAELLNWGQWIVRLEVDFLEHILLASVPLELPDEFGKLLIHIDRMKVITRKFKPRKRKHLTLFSVRSW